MAATDPILPPEMGVEPQAPLLDGDHLRRQTGGDAQLAGEVLTLFCGQIGEQLPRFDGQGEEARALALHTLKGAAAAVGAFALAERLAAAERHSADASELSEARRVARETLALARRLLA